MLGGIIGTIQRGVYSLSLVVGLVGLFIGLSPSDLLGEFDFKAQPMKTINFSEHDFTWNTNLVKPKEQEVYGDSIVVGPESIAIAPGSGLWYTGTADGYIKEIDPVSGKIRNILRHHKGPQCEEYQIDHAHECGRYLQLRFHEGQLYAIEANTGLYLIDIERGTKTFKAKSPFKHRNYLYNSFAFDPKLPNLVYITVSSSRWDLQNIMWSFLENDNTGYIFGYDLATGKAIRFIDNLAMVNGIDVDAKGEMLVYSESLAASVSALQLQSLRNALSQFQSGHKVTGLQPKELLPLLPGNPDNVIVQGDTAFVAVPLVHTPLLEAADYFMKWEWARTFVAKLFFTTGKLCELANKQIANHHLARCHREFVSGLILYKLLATKSAAVVEYNLRTKQKRLHGTDQGAYISEAQLDHQGNLVMGSFRNPWIYRVPYTKWK